MEEQSKLIIKRKNEGKATYPKNIKYITIDRYNKLKLKEWTTIQNELSALVTRKAEMKKLTRVQRMLKRRIKDREEHYDQIIHSKFNSEYA
jgi:hypothetical protein